MARGISIGDVENKVQNINDNNVIPLSTGADVPEVVTVGVLKEHINEDIDTALEGKQDVINDLAAIRSGAALGATALQSYTESDPTVPEWAKESQKPSYSYSEITGTPTLSAVATSGSYNDLSNKPTIPTVPTNVSAFTNDAGYLTEHQDISGKANSDDLATVAFSGNYEDLTNTPTIPDVPEWAMSSTKPSYTVSEIDGAQEELESGVNIKTINGTSVLGSGNITVQGGGGGGDVNVIESITFNGSVVPVDSSKNAAIIYTAPVTSVNGNTGAVTLSIPDAQVQSDWNATTGMGVILNKPTIPTVPTISTNITTDGSDDTKTASPKAVKTFVEGKGYLTSETEPDFNGSAAAGITSSDITAWNGKADKSEMSVSTSGDQTTITLKSGTSATVINQHQSLSGYVQTSSTAGLIKNDGTIDTTSYGTYSKPSGGIPASDIASGVIPDVSGMENTSNKVTSLSSSSTDTEYPSAKAVYDLVGDIETLLAAI